MKTRARRFARQPPENDDVAIICHNTTEAINLLAYRLRFDADDVVVTTVAARRAIEAVFAADLESAEIAPAARS